MKNILAICFGILVIGLHPIFSEDVNFNLDAYTNKLQNSHCTYMEKVLGLNTYGTGGSQPSDFYRYSFFTEKDKLVTLSEARRTFVYAMEPLLKKVNGDKKLRPYLHYYPFTHKRVSLYITFHSPKGVKKPPRPYICEVDQSVDRQVCYYVYDADLKKEVEIHRETYEQALDIINKERRENER